MYVTFFPRHGKKLTRIGEATCPWNISSVFRTLCVTDADRNMNGRKKYHTVKFPYRRKYRPVKEFSLLFFFLFLANSARVRTVKNTIRYSINHAKRIERDKSGLCATRASYATSISRARRKLACLFHFPLWVTPCEADLAAERILLITYNRTRFAATDYRVLFLRRKTPGIAYRRSFRIDDRPGGKHTRALKRRVRSHANRSISVTNSSGNRLDRV